VLGPGSVLAEEEEKAWEKRNVFSLDLKTATESLLRIVFGSEFQTAGAEHRKARFANVVFTMYITKQLTQQVQPVCMTTL